jgi:hypothetical protein
MTRKDFVLIANVLLASQPTNWSPNVPQSLADSRWETVVHCMAAALADTNTRFDRERFLKACGVNS